LLLAALLCSSDVVAAVSIVDFESQPKLYKCIFGEGIANDIVSIVLFNVVLVLQSVTFSAAMPFKVIGQFFFLGVVSTLVGVLFGLLNCLIFKYTHSWIKGHAVIEVFIIILTGVASYFVAEFIVILDLVMSGIISILACGIVQSHYTYYNLSDQGKLMSTFVVTWIE